MDTQQNGAGAFIFYNNMLLLQLRDGNTKNYPYTNALIAGAFEEKDKNDSFKVIVREVEEETQLKISRIRVVKIGTESLLSKNAFNHFFIIHITLDEVRMIRCKEGKKLRFFSHEKIRQLHQMGEKKFGLGGAIFRFMTHEPEIIEAIFVGEPNPFTINRK